MCFAKYIFYAIVFLAKNILLISVHFTKNTYICKQKYWHNNTQIVMDKIFERHDEYLSTTPMNYVRRFSEQIDWSLHLVIIKGPK